MLPPDQSPVGTTVSVPRGATAEVISVTSAVGVSTLIPVTIALYPANENVAPWADTPAMSPYATRKVALPLMRAPTDPLTEADARVALPLNDIGPLMDRAPLVPAERIVVEM